MKIIKNNISIEELKIMSEKMFHKLVKAVVDIEQEIMAVDADLHVDLEELLLEDESSEQDNLWGINFHPEKSDDEFVEFDSMINVRPLRSNRSIYVENAEIRKRILKTVNKLVTR